MHPFESIRGLVTWTPTGSRVIAPAAVTADSDEDFVLLVTDARAASQELAQGDYFSTGGDNYTTRDEVMYTMRGRASSTVSKHNLILLEDMKAYTRWHVATKLATALGLYDKADRVMLFRTIQTGGLGFCSREQAEQHMASTTGSVWPPRSFSFRSVGQTIPVAPATDDLFALNA